MLNLNPQEIYHSMRKHTESSNHTNTFIAIFVAINSKKSFSCKFTSEKDTFKRFAINVNYVHARTQQIILSKITLKFVTKIYVNGFAIGAERILATKRNSWHMKESIQANSHTYVSIVMPNSRIKQITDDTSGITKEGRVSSVKCVAKDFSRGVN